MSCRHPLAITAMIIAACEIIAPAAVNAQPSPDAMTVGGASGAPSLRVVCGSEGGVALSSAEQSVTRPGDGAAVWVTDVASGKATKVSSLAKNVDKNEMLQANALDDLRLDAEVHWKALDDGRLFVSGSIQSRDENDRAIDVSLKIPLSKSLRWEWWRDFAFHDALLNRPADSPEVEQHDIPVAAVTDEAGKLGVAVAVPADDPCLFSLRVDKDGNFVADVRRGISSSAAGPLKRRAPFSFLVYPVRGEWGMRDALSRYYAFYPKLFQRRAKSDGLWLFAHSTGDVPDPQDFAFHETRADAKTVTADDQAKIGTFAYFIVGQREFDKVPGDMAKGDILPFVQAAKDKGPAPTPKGKLAEMIESSAVQTADQNLNGIVRRAPFIATKGDDPSKWPYRLTFPVNPNPALWSDQPDRQTVGRSALADIDAPFQKFPTLDGIYLDSLNAWGQYLNYRKDHLSYATIAPTYDPVTKRVVLDNALSHIEFLRTLGDKLHGQDKLLFGNGIVQGRAFHGFLLDVLGAEQPYPQLLKDDLSKYRLLRTIAAQKPYLMLDEHEEHWHDINVVRKAWMAATLYGIFPSFHRVAQTDPQVYQQHKPIIDQYLPITRRLSAAGWQPVTAATTDQKRVLMERFGPGADGTTFFSFYNLGPTARTHVTINAEALAKVANVRELVTSQSLHAGNTFDLELPQGEVRVVECTP